MLLMVGFTIVACGYWQVFEAIDADNLLQILGVEVVHDSETYGGS